MSEAISSAEGVRSQLQLPEGCILILKAPISVRWCLKLCKLKGESLARPSKWQTNGILLQGWSSGPKSSLATASAEE